MPPRNRRVWGKRRSPLTAFSSWILRLGVVRQCLTARALLSGAASACRPQLPARSTLSSAVHILLFFVVLGHASLGAAPASAQEWPPDPRFGAVEAFRDPVAAAEAGVAWDRILFYWSELQPTGPQDWNGYHVPDDWLQQADQDGREVVGLLKHTPAWATDGPPGCGEPRGLDLPIDDPGNLWAAFVRRTVTIYGDRIHRWIIWNEPDIDLETYGNEWCGSLASYYRLLKVAYLAAHQIDPDVKIHLAGLTFWHDREYLDRFLAHAVQDPTGAEHGYYFDAVSLHIYFQTESVPFIINEARAALRAQGIDKPIWVNEMNASPDTDPEWPLVRPRWRVSLEEQASFILQSFALALSSGAERMAVYKLSDAGLPPGGEPFGLLRPDGSRRPAYEAYSLLTTHFAGTGHAREEPHSLYRVVTLQRDVGTTRVVWARTGSEVSVALPASGAQARLIDQAGVEQQIEPVDGSYFLTLPGARCADEYLGCIIGGPTFLLVETDAEPISEPAATPIVTVTRVAPTTDGTTISPLATPTVQSTLPPSPTVPPTSTPTPRPTDTPTPTLSPPPTSTGTPTPSRTATATPSLTATATERPTPTDTTPALTETPSQGGSGLAPGFGGSAVLVILGLGAASVALWIMARSREGA